MPNLFPEDYEEEEVTESEIEDDSTGYQPGVAFDYETGDFIRDGKSRLLESDGIESWKSWCINCITTERYMHLAYNTDFGIEITEAMQATSQEEAESILTREITEAILADPYERTEYIENIEYSWDAPDSVRIDLTIHGIDDVTIDITVNITKEEV